MIYFAHAMEDYGTPRERNAIQALQRTFGLVLNPSDPEHAAAYEAIKSTEMARRMDFWTDLARSCEQGVAVMLTRDMRLGPGVAKEALEATVFDRPTYRVDDNGAIYSWRLCTIPVMTIEETRERLKCHD